jgi:endonuclease YncB( thermonuclease family)
MGWIVAGVVAVGAIAAITDDEPAPASSSDQPAAEADGEPEVEVSGDAEDVEPGSSPSPAAEEEKSARPTTYRVRSVTDGDTLQLANGDTVRLVGIDAPENGACGSERATDLLSRLTRGQRATLTAPVDVHDRYDRLLRYVDVGAKDAGLELIRRGLAIARYDSRDGYDRHARQQRYVRTDHATPDVSCAPVPFVDAPPPSDNCAPGYSPCVPSYPPDLDCADTGPVTVSGSDPHGLDADGDGVACGGD